MKCLLITLTILASMAAQAEQIAFGVPAVKAASEQALELYKETGNLQNEIIEGYIDDIDEVVSVKKFLYLNESSNLANLVSNYYVVVEGDEENNVYQCNSNMIIKVLGTTVFSLQSSETTCEFSHIGEDVYQP